MLAKMRLALAGLLAAACGETITGLPNRPGGNPVVPEVALFPFPSSYYLAPAEDTPTKRHLLFPRGVLPEGFEPAVFKDIDGYSPVPAIVTAFPRGVDPATLPPASDPGATVRDDSPIFLLRAGDAAPVAILAELDAYAEDPAEQSLILRPHAALAFDTDYVVVIRDRLKSADGTPLPVGEAFRALRDEIDTDSPEVERQRADYELVNATIAAKGLEREEVVLAWIFHTRSEDQVTRPLLAMHDHMAAAVLPPCELTGDRLDDTGENRLIEGTVEVPSFLDRDERLILDGAGLPMAQGARSMAFVLTIPTAIDTVPRPVLTFGHGFFSSRYEATRATGNASLRRWKLPAISIDFDGFNQERMFETGLVFAGAFEQLGRVVSLQMQAQAQFTALAKLVQDQLADRILDASGAPILSKTEVHYFGISNGGTQGATILAASPVFTRGALVVPGGGWTHMVQRAVQWNMIQGLLETKLPDPRDTQLALSLAQQLFDPVDAMSWSKRIAVDRFPGRPPVEVTLHEAVGDVQVSNLVTDWLARSAEIPLVAPAPRPIYGLTDFAPGMTRALFVYDEKRTPPPEGNRPPLEDNGAHEGVRRLEAYLEQTGRFLERGEIVQVCDGACDPG